MKIGLTYDLRSDYLAEGYSMEETAEFDKESTIEGIENAISGWGHETIRIGNSRHLIKALINGDRWDMVFNICEGLYGDGREALVPALLDSWRIPYVFSGPVTLGVALNKAFAKSIVRDAGINTPDFAVVTKTEDVQHVRLDYPLFAKPLSEGTGKGIEATSLIRDENELKPACISLLERFRQPVLVEEYLPGREFTAGICGNGNEARVLGVMEVGFNKDVQEIYSYETKENYLDLVNYRKVEGPLLEECVEVALNSWKALNCLDGGRVDLRVDKHGRVSFIEVNPLAGLNPESSDLPILCRLNGISYHELMGQILEAAITRNFGPKK